MVLNTSFNVFPGEPIVESPRDALRAFHGGKGPELRIGRLVFCDTGTTLVPRACPLDFAAASGGADSSYRGLEPRRRVGRFASEVCAGSAGGSGESRVRVRAEGVLADDARWVDLFDDLELALLEACDGGATVGDLLDAFATTPVFSSTTFTFGGPAEEEEEEGEASEAGEGEYKGAEVTEAEVLIRLYRLWDATLLEF